MKSAGIIKLYEFVCTLCTPVNTILIVELCIVVYGAFYIVRAIATQGVNRGR